MSLPIVTAKDTLVLETINNRALKFKQKKSRNVPETFANVRKFRHTSPVVTSRYFGALKTIYCAHTTVSSKETAPSTLTGRAFPWAASAGRRRLPCGRISPSPSTFPAARGVRDPAGGSRDTEPSAVDLAGWARQPACGRWSPAVVSALPAASSRRWDCRWSCRSWSV